MSGWLMLGFCLVSASLKSSEAATVGETSLSDRYELVNDRRILVRKSIFRLEDSLRVSKSEEEKSDLKLEIEKLQNESRELFKEARDLKNQIIVPIPSSLAKFGSIDEEIQKSGDIKRQIILQKIKNNPNLLAYWNSLVKDYNNALARLPSTGMTLTQSESLQRLDQMIKNIKGRKIDEIKGREITGGCLEDVD